jgi:hypothetical protein
MGVTLAGLHRRCAKDRRVIRLSVTALLLVCVTFLCRPLLLIVFPGALLISSRSLRLRYLSDLIPVVMGVSMAFWVVSFWFLPYLKLPLSWWAAGTIVSATVGLGIGLWRSQESTLIDLDREEIIALILLLVAVVLRWSFFWRWPLAPAGADMSMHSYMAALIMAHDTVPSSHRPLLPIDGFGAYPAGFQVLTALIALVGDLPVFRSALLMEVITLSFLTFAFYSVLRTLWDRQTSAMVALLVTFLPWNPQRFIQWGGDPTLLALAFCVMSLGYALSSKVRMSLGACCIGALMTAAGVVTHLIPVIGLLYVMIPVAAYTGLSAWWAKRSEMKPLAWNLLHIVGFSAILLAPFLPSLFSTTVSSAEIEWVKQFQRQGAGGAWGGTLGNAIESIPHYLLEKIFGAPFVILGCLGLVTLAWRWPDLAVPSIIGVLTVIGLVINSMYWVLPLSYAIYPERTAILLLLPVALGLSALVVGVRQLFAERHITVYLMSALIVSTAIHNNEQLFFTGLIPNSLLTQADLKAMRWIQDNTAAGMIFQNKYGDAGLWIPAIAFRGITDPHLNPFYFDEFQAASSGLKAHYAYVGKKKVLGEPISLAGFESAPDRYRKVYDDDGVIIYKVIDPSGARESGSAGTSK